jgi:CRISPR-associated protein Csd1
MLTNPKYRLFVGDATVLFWAERTGIYEDLIGELFNPSSESENEEVNEKDVKTRNLARDIIEKYTMGLNLNKEEYDLDPNTNVHILGIYPNNARLSIAFYEVNTFEYFIKRLADHYNNMKIVGNIKAIPLWVILNETLPKASKDKKISPVLSKSLMNSIFTGNLYPASLYNAMISRIRADRDINYKRVAIIKACLMRKYKLFKIKEEISVSLNENSSSVPYQLGRLFAVLEKAQMEALKISTIKDRYFTSASATPASVFPVLMKLSLHHTAKAEYGKNLENKKGEILKKVSQFPKHLSLDEQGEFILGYYHQTQAFYVKKENKENKENKGEV